MLGNRTDVNENGTVTSYYSNSLNQYTSVGGTGFSHDKNGNVIDDGLYKYYYDCENRLTDVNDQSDNRVASYKYDYLGRRIKKIVYGSPNVVTKYCYDGGRVVTEYNGNDNLKLAYVYGAGIDEPVCFYNYSTWTTYYFHYDGLGNVIAISDDYQDIAERYEYDVYGGCIVHTDAGQDGQWMTADDTTDTESAAGNPYLFTGRRYDPETALYYYRARYYDYSTGRFLQPDPLGYVDGLNLYSYVENDPINAKDPMGLKNPPSCYKLCQDIHWSAVSPKGCALKCCSKGSAGVSTCLIAANNGLKLCLIGCNTSDDNYDPRPAEKYRKAMKAAYKGCKSKNGGALFLLVLLLAPLYRKNKKRMRYIYQAD